MNTAFIGTTIDRKTSSSTKKLRPSTNPNTIGVYLSTTVNRSAVTAVSPPTNTSTGTPSNADGMYRSRSAATASTVA